MLLWENIRRAQHDERRRVQCLVRPTDILLGRFCLVWWCLFFWSAKQTLLALKTTDIPKNALYLTDRHCTNTVPLCTGY